jgi:hypothetical protein
VRGQVAREDLAVVLDAHLRGEREDVVGAAHLVERICLGDAELQGDEVGDLLLAGDQQLRGLEEDLLALVAGQLGRVARRGLEGFAGMGGVARRHRADHLVRVGIAHLDDAVCVDLAPGDAHGLVTGRSCEALSDAHSEGFLYSAAADWRAST